MAINVVQKVKCLTIGLTICLGASFENHDPILDLLKVFYKPTEVISFTCLRDYHARSTVVE